MTDKIGDIKGEVWSHFGEAQFIYLATCEGEQPRVRPVTLLHLDDRFWVLTGTDNAKVAQMQKNPKIEFCLLVENGDNCGYVRGAALAKIIQNRAIKAKIAERCDFFDRHWKSADDPDYTLIELCLTEIEYLRQNELMARKFEL